MRRWYCGACGGSWETPEARQAHWRESEDCEGGVLAMVRRSELRKAYEEIKR